MRLQILNNHSKLARLQRKLLLIKIWFVCNCFVFLPFSSWLFFVYLNPRIELLKNPTLTSWASFWFVAFVFAQMIYCCFIAYDVNTVKERLERIQGSLE